MSNLSREQQIAGLKAELFKMVEANTPEAIKSQPFFDLSNPNEIKFKLTGEIIDKFNLDRWLADYEKEAKVSTGGIRGPQNILYYWDTRFPINQLGVALATLGKALVLKDQIANRQINKIVSGEVRYNTPEYIDLISRIEAAMGIKVHLPNHKITTIWLASFLIFMQDYDGGEYVTSSHAISSKTATKDLDSQGSQFLPEMSLAFVNKIKEIFAQAKSSPDGYTITLAAKNNPLIVRDFDGFDLYTQYLKNGVATEVNLGLIRTAQAAGLKIIFDTVGGCFYQNMPPIFQRLGILDAFTWRNQIEDPFFHGIGKTWRENPKTGIKEFFDLSCDVSLSEVARTMGYEDDLKDKEIGCTILITDPDSDRLLIGQVESVSRATELAGLGIDYLQLTADKVFVIYHPTQSFLMTMDFHMRQLKAAGLWDKHSRVMITTAPSSRAWDEWAKSCNVKIVTTPVGFKEIAMVMKKIEKQVLANLYRPVILTNIFNQGVDLGVDPKIVFAGEESGGMITGPEVMISSAGGRRALAMREKSAGEASVIMAALVANLFLTRRSLLDYLQEIFTTYNIISRYYLREDIIYYNESEPDPVKLREAKLAGEIRRDNTDKFYLSLALLLRQQKIVLDQVKQVLTETFSNLDFAELEDLIFVGESSYFKFKKLFVQIRRSGTDAKMRGYACGQDKNLCQKYLNELLHYDGKKTASFDKIIPADFYANIYQLVEKLYREYLYKDY